MGSKLLNAYIIVRINALRVASAPVLTNTPQNFYFPFRRKLLPGFVRNYVP